MRNWSKALPIAALALALACSNDVGDPSLRSPGGPSLLTTPINGASFTTVNEGVDGTGHCKNGNPNVNCNQYDGKQYVWMNGGPVSAQIGPDGDYFFAVLDPGGQGGNDNPNDGTPHNLSDVSPTSGTGAGDPWTARVFTVSGGVISYSGPHDFDDQKIRLIPYDNTTNPGGVYIMAICSLADRDVSAVNEPGVGPSACKYDAFKVREGDECTDCGEEGNPQLQLFKYFDTNINGQWDDGEPGIGNWLIDVTSGGSAITGSPFSTIISGPDLGKAFLTVDPGTYRLVERQASSFPIGGGPAQGIWKQTGNTVIQYFDFLNSTTLNANKTYDVTAVLDGFTTGLNFGNVCSIRPGGRTLGFWSNKNGLALITAGNFTALTAFNLRNANGSGRDFTGSLAQNKTAFSNWLLSANASNMAYMLSAQMSATYLDVANGFTDGTVVVDGARTISQEIDYANSLLANPIVGGPFSGQNGSVTIAGSALRTEQERVKNIFDKINNNGSLGDFLQGPEFCLAHVSFPS